MATSVRYIVDDTDDLSVYELLGFTVLAHPSPGFAVLERGGTRLLLNVPGGGGGAGRTTTGATPRPGGWNRLQLEVDSLDELVTDLAAAGVRIRSGVVDGRGGRQAIVEDTSGNPFELFEPAAR
ncbi:VOC family protein [Nocardioides sp. SYSU D00038]|uniref:VOC family protein n=1 Tax=Nocardioides sp. SYSU D00038 TaxID=2812554 RepID=UPI00196817FF|nr:VOC family protein [Nocardioides sp. SYSU D00038]